MLDRDGKPSPVTGWTLRYEGLVPGQEGLREALCTVGNGYFATRGAAPESRADATHYPGTYIAGCYNELRTEIAGHTVANESLVNAPNWLPVTFAAEGGPWLGPGETKVLEHQQELDLRRGVLTRRLRVRDSQGRITRATCRRFVHMGAAHLAALEMTIVPENWSGRLRVRSELDGTVQNAGVPRYRDLASRHLVPVEARSLDTAAVLLVVETSQSHIRIAKAARTRLFRNGARVAQDPAVIGEPGRTGLEIVLDVTEEDQVTVEKIVAIATSRDHATSDAAVAAAGWLETADSFDEMLGQHVLAWAYLWARFHIELKGSDDRVLPVLRLHIFHLLQTVSPNSMDRDVGIPARGLNGEAYRGHVFWDDMFVFPVLNLRLPELSRSLTAYRYRRLPARELPARPRRLPRPAARSRSRADPAVLTLSPTARRRPRARDPGGVSAMKPAQSAGPQPRRPGGRHHLHDRAHRSPVARQIAVPLAAAVRRHPGPPEPRPRAASGCRARAGGTTAKGDPDGGWYVREGDHRDRKDNKGKALPERFHLPARALGYQPVMDDKTGQPGIQANTSRAILVEGLAFRGPLNRQQLPAFDLLNAGEPPERRPADRRAACRTRRRLQAAIAWRHPQTPTACCAYPPAGLVGWAHPGALPCAGLPAVIVSSAVSPKLSQLASGASHPRGAPLAELRAVRRARSLVRRTRSLPA